MNEFLNPKSMVTPGVAGALVMFIANAIISQFPEAAFRWVVISLSFVVGAVVFYAIEMPLFQRVGFWGINSLIIFSVGIGTSNVASFAQRLPAPPSALIDLLVSPAHAQPGGHESCPDERERLKAEVVRKEEQIASLTRRLDSAQRTSGFFKRW